MNFKTKACECLEMGNYEEYYNNILKYHNLTNSEESSEELRKAKKKFELFKEIKEFLKKEKACYYEVLSLPTSASSKQIREAYTKLMNKFHPDRTKIKESNAVSRIIQKAYSILSDPEKRQEYDLKKNSLFYKRGENFSFVMSNNFSDDFFDLNRISQRAYNTSSVFTDDFEEIFMTNSRFFDAHFGSHVYNNLMRNLNRRHSFRRHNRTPQDERLYYKMLIFIFFIIVLLFLS
ncbi:DnaJ like protein subfamily B member 9 [Nosema granulosis]|uniref:DnaJ like protein subfamily B member 9 n=1 Tax=Nosema granulosis TaxID=83296 RepID=A0A9P6H1N0_9MICR|nr:DnaJ like protein subfamily B member 9 [Nosema granulosis]